MRRLLVGMTLNDDHRDFLCSKGLKYDEVHLHNFTFDFDEQEVRSLLKAPVSLVITSGRALRALEAVPPESFDRAVYVVGQRTAARLADLGFSRITPAANCEELIALNPWTSDEQLVYLCGNLRRNILPEYWQAHRITYQELEVYQTLLTYPVVELFRYDIALVSSPSGVESLLEKNVFPTDYAFAAIGPVTAGELQKKGFTNVITPALPSFELLIETIIKAEA